MDHFQPTAADYAAAAASDAKRAADKGNERIAYLEKRVARLGQIIDRLVRKVGKL